MSIKEINTKLIEVESEFGKIRVNNISSFVLSCVTLIHAGYVQTISTDTKPGDLIIDTLLLSIFLYKYFKGRKVKQGLLEQNKELLNKKEELIFNSNNSLVKLERNEYNKNRIENLKKAAKYDVRIQAISLAVFNLFVIPTVIMNNKNLIANIYIELIWLASPIETFAGYISLKRAESKFENKDNKVLEKKLD